MRTFKGDDISNRLIDLAAGVLKLVPSLRRHPVGLNIARQLERCAASGGANYEEARGAESAADFVHKVRVALKEVRETRYWLRLAVRAGLLEQEYVVKLLDESHQLIAILTASANTARRRIEKP